MCDDFQRSHVQESKVTMVKQVACLRAGASNRSNVEPRKRLKLCMVNARTQTSIVTVRFSSHVCNTVEHGMPLVRQASRWSGASWSAVKWRRAYAVVILDRRRIVHEGWLKGRRMLQARVGCQWVPVFAFMEKAGQNAFRNSVGWAKMVPWHENGYMAILSELLAQKAVGSKNVLIIWKIVSSEFLVFSFELFVFSFELFVFSWINCSWFFWCLKNGYVRELQCMEHVL